MITRIPTENQPENDPTGALAAAVKSQSAKQFLLTSVTAVAVGICVVSALAIGVWLARKQVATTTIQGFLRSKGVTADIQIEKLQFNAAQIRDLRIGPANKPTLTADLTTLAWHYDSKARLFVIDSLKIDGAKIFLSINEAGQIDFGALKPFIVPSTGPKRSSINGVQLHDAIVTLNLPQGVGRARLSVWGGEVTGLRGRADVTLPAFYVVDPDLNDPGVSAPIRLGFATQQFKDSAGSAISDLGFALFPAGQHLRYQDFKVRDLRGAITGKVAFGPKGIMRVDTRAATLTAAALTGPGLRASSTQIQMTPVFWQQGRAWHTTGWGNGALLATLANVQLERAQLSAQSTRFLVRAARSDSGRIQVDFQTDLRGLNGALKAGRGQIAGNITTTTRDLSKVMDGMLQGRSTVQITDAALPSALSRQIKGWAPGAIGALADDMITGQTALSYRYARGDGEIALAGPLLLTGASGVRASWTQNGGPAPALVFKSVKDAPLQADVVGSGRINVTIPKLGELQALIDGATASTSGTWALIGRYARVQSFSPAQSSLRLDRFEISSLQNGSPRGRASGQINIGGNASKGAIGQGVLSLDVAGDVNKITARLNGPMNGFGDLFGGSRNGIGQGSLNLDLNATRFGNAWLLMSSGRFTANTLATSAMNVSGIRLDLKASGRVNLTPNVPPSVVAQVGLEGSATGVRQGLGSGARAFGGARFQTMTRATGNLNRLALTGTFSGQAARSALMSYNFDNAATTIAYDSIFSGNGMQLIGATTSSLGRISQTTGVPTGRVDVRGLHVTGPVRISKGTSKANSALPFWSGVLSQAASTSQTNVTAQLRIKAQSIAQGTTRISDVTLSGPLSAQTQTGARADGWRATSNMVFGARSLTAGDTILNGLTARGALSVSRLPNRGIGISSSKCVNFGARSGSFPGDARVDVVTGDLCPNAAGQLAVYTGSNFRIVATASLDPLSIQMGDRTRGQSIEISEVNGVFTNKPGGGVDLALLATQFGLSLKMPDGSTALVKANEAALDIIPQAGGIGLTGRIGQVSSIGLPVLLSGGATADLVVGTRGLNGTFNFDDIIVRDTEKLPRFGEVKLIGSGVLAGNQVTITSQVYEPVSNIKLARLNFGHNISDGSGNLVVDANDLLFSPNPVGPRRGLEIAALLPPLRGVVTDLVGVVNADANFAWARNAPIISRGNVNTKGVDFGILLGAVTGVSGDLSFDDLLSARTAGSQTIKVGMLNTGGIPIENGVVLFTLPGNNSLRLQDASWPFADGKLSVRPATWQFRDSAQNFSIDVEDVDLAKLLRLTNVPNLEIDGRVSGVFPIEVREGNVEIVGGRLKAREGGGVIRYTGPNPSPPAPPPSQTTRLRERLFGKPPPTGANLAIEALRALEYKILEITVDGRITGELKLGVILEGANQQVLSGVPFRFNIKMNVPIGQLIDNMGRLNNAGTSPQVLEEMDRLMREDAAGAATAPPIPQQSSPPQPSPQPPSPPPPSLSPPAPAARAPVLPQSPDVPATTPQP